MDTIQSFTYNDLGQIAELKRGGHQADMSYEYDLLQGVLRGISSNCGFVQTLHREDNTQHPLYNGSISSMEWHYPGETELHKYAYDYDSYNRLTDAVYSQTVYSASASRSRGADSMMEELPVNRLVPAPELQSTANTSRYGTSYSYDKHGNILSLERRGMMNSRSYGVIDDLTVTYNGNRRVSVSDAAGSLTYDGASDFVDGASTSTEYMYDNNGSLTKDQNRGITEIQYDLLGNPKKITFLGNRTIEYLYSSEGKRMRAIHSYPQNPNVTSSALHRDTTDYVCGLILKNRHPESYQFDGGYATFTNDSYSGWHYYVQDYLGSNRLVVNRNGTVEQKTHYYPYGGMMGDISTNESTQKYKFEGKELDRSFGLDDYDIHARNYYAMLPMWDRVDPLAEKYYGISPYVYCGGDPVNRGDVDGKWIQCAIGALIGGAVESGIEISEQYRQDGEIKWGKVGIAFGKGALSGAIGASGGGLLYRLAANSIGDAVVETLGQVAEISINERETLSETEITHAFVGGVVSTAGGEAFSKGLKNTIKTITNTDSFIHSTKTKAKQYLQGIKESSVSTANDKEVKDLAKSLRDQTRQLSEKIGERVGGGVLQGVTSYGNREIDKKNKK